LLAELNLKIQQSSLIAAVAHHPSLFRVWVDNAGIEPANFVFAEPTLKLSK
jgi:hypothetical protein